MFNLEQSITEWRHQMLSGGIKSPALLDELESHLREEIEQQMSAGLPAEKAVAVAIQKIGRTETIKTEFAKTDGDKKSTHYERWIIGLMSFCVIIPLGVYIVLKDEMSLGWRLAGFADFAVIALSIIYWRRLNQIFPVVLDRRIRLTIGLGMAALGIAGIIILANFILPHFSFTEGQLCVVVLWGLTVMAALGGVTSGLEEAARKQTSTPI